MLSLLTLMVVGTPAAIPAGVSNDPVLGVSARTARNAAPVVMAPRVRINLNDNGTYVSGDRVTVRVQVGVDGYLTVFRVNPDGLIRVLFPLDPGDDAFVRGGKEYELRGRGDRETFLADAVDGNGLIYAAVSLEPLRFDRFASNGHWDYDVLRLNDSSRDAENDLTSIVSAMTNRGRFDYDAVGYSIEPANAIATTAGDGYYPGYYDPVYNPAWRCLGCGWGYPGGDLNIGLNFWYSPYWDPFLFSPWSYGYYGRNHYPYGGYYGYSGHSWFPGYPVIIDRTPRRPLPPGTRSRPRPYDRPYPGVTSHSPTVRNAPPPPARDRGNGVGTRSRPRPSNLPEPGRRSAPPPSPTYREPAGGGANGGGSARPSIDRSRPRARPVYREPPRVESAPPPRVERGSSPSDRSSPSSHAAPAPRAPESHAEPPRRSRPPPNPR